MKKCCKCGVNDQDYDKTGYQDESGYYCFNCKPKAVNIQDTTNHTSHTNHTSQSASQRSHSVNKIATLIKGFAFFMAACYFVLALYTATQFSGYSNSNAFFVFFSTFTTGFIMSLFMYAIGEIVQLLHNIDQNTKV